MAKARGNTKQEAERLRSTLLDVEDALSRLIHLCHLGGLAADGMHGLGENRTADALSLYFTLLDAEIETLRRLCAAGR